MWLCVSQWDWKMNKSFSKRNSVQWVSLSFTIRESEGVYAHLQMCGCICVYVCACTSAMQCEFCKEKVRSKWPHHCLLGAYGGEQFTRGAFNVKKNNILIKEVLILSDLSTVQHHKTPLLRTLSKFLNILYLDESPEHSLHSLICLWKLCKYWYIPFDCPLFTWQWTSYSVDHSFSFLF